MELLSYILLIIGGLIWFLFGVTAAIVTMSVMAVVIIFVGVYLRVKE